MQSDKAAAHRRLVAVGWQVAGTGLTRVFSNLLAELTTEWTVDVAGVGYSGPGVTDAGIRIHPTEAGGRDTFGVHAAKQLMLENRPDVVFCHHDLWILNRYARQLGPHRNGSMMVAYVPIDGEIVDHRLLAPLLDFDLVLAYTPWARREIESGWDRLGATDRPLLDVLPHGLDHESFAVDPELEAGGFAREGRSTARSEVFPGLPDPDRAFIVLNPSRPALRKRLDLTIEGFALFVRHASKHAKLCLHHAVSDAQHEREVQDLVRRFDLGDRVILNPLGSRVVSDRELNRLYQACDVGLNTSMGEGWGLTSFEHAATGGAQVVPDHSACGELWRDSAELISIARRTVPQFSPLRMAEVDPQSVADVLSRLYADPDLCRRRSRQAHAKATTHTLSWHAVGHHLRNLLNH